MESARRFSVTLPSGVAEIIEAKIKSGAYASVSELLCDGVQALLDRDDALEKMASRGGRRRTSRISRRSVERGARAHQGAARRVVGPRLARCFHFTPLPPIQFRGRSAGHADLHLGAVAREPLRQEEEAASVPRGNK